MLFLGIGQVALAVRRALPASRPVRGTTRSPERIEEIRLADIEPIVLPNLEAVRSSAKQALILVSFPPDGLTDALLAPACSEASALVYLSSTAVYGGHRGVVDDTTSVDRSEPRARMRLDAEDRWRGAGAVVLRCPALYDASSGLHRRLAQGTVKIPEGEGIGSRIHTDDLAALVLAALDHGRPGETYVVGDLCPASHGEVIRWMCEKQGWALPPVMPLSEVPVTMRASRAVDASRALRELGVTLRYPSYREGYGSFMK